MIVKFGVAVRTGLKTPMLFPPVRLRAELAVSTTVFPDCICPVAVTFIVGAVTGTPKLIWLPLNAIVPLAVIVFAPEVLRLSFVLMVTFENVAPPEAKDSRPSELSDMVADPVVFKVRRPTNCTFMLPMAPEPVLNVAELPVRRPPDVCVIVPVPLARTDVEPLFMVNP